MEKRREEGISFNHRRECGIREEEGGTSPRDVGRKRIIHRWKCHFYRNWRQRVGETNKGV